MNEEALKDAYKLFQSGGYNGSLEDYSTLISTNPDALKDSYAMFKDSGYNGSEDEFSNLVGLKKKDQTEPSTESAQETTELVSEEQPMGGGSESATVEQLADPRETGIYEVDQEQLSQIQSSLKDPLKDFSPIVEERAFGKEGVQAVKEQRIEQYAIKKAEKERFDAIAETPMDAIDLNLQQIKDKKQQLESQVITPIQTELEANLAELEAIKAELGENFTDEQAAEYNAMVDAFNEKVKTLEPYAEQYKNALKAEEAALKDKQIKRSQKGTYGGALRNSLVEGQGSITKFATRLSTRLMSEIMPEALAPDYDPETGLYGGKTKEEILKQTDDFTQEVGNSLLKAWGTEETTPEYIGRKQEDFFDGAILGVARSIPAMVGNVPGLAAQAINDGYETIDEVAGDNLTRGEKEMYGVAFGVVQATLEKIGLQSIMNKGLISKLTNSALDKIIDSGEKVTASKLNQVVTEMAKPLLRGGTGEFLTGSGQEIGSIGLERITNALKGKEIFDEKSFAEETKRILISGAQEMIGGLVMSAPAAVMRGTGAAFTKEHEIAETALEGDGFQDIVDYVQVKQKQGEISQEEGDQIIKETREFAELNSQIPNEMPVENKLEAFKLLKEKQQLEAEIEGKDPALVQKKIDRIKGKKVDGEQVDGINQELEKLQATKTPVEVKRESAKVEVQTKETIIEDDNTNITPDAGVKETQTAEQIEVKEAKGIINPKKAKKYKENKEVENTYSNSELKEIGTKEEYTEYLSSVFPESTIDDIVYHGGVVGIDEIRTKNKREDGTEVYGAYFGDKNHPEIKGSRATGDVRTYAAIITEGGKNKGVDSIENTATIDDSKLKLINDNNIGVIVSEDYVDKSMFPNSESVNDDGLLAREYVVFDQSNIHVLGSKKDIEGFKSFIENKNKPSIKAAKKPTPKKVSPKPNAKKTEAKTKQETAKKKEPTKTEVAKTFKSAFTKGAETADSFLADLEKQLDNFGKETLGMNLPVAVAKAAVKAARLAVQGGMTASQAVDAAINKVKETEWYKKLSDKNKAGAEQSVKDIFDGKLNVAEREKDAEPPKGKKERRAGKRLRGVARDKGEAIRNSLDDFYTPQVQKEIKGKTKEMSDTELLEKMSDDGLRNAIDGEDNISIAAAIELFQRKIERGEETEAVYTYLNKMGTKMGQLIAQYAMLERATPAGLSKLVRTAVNQKDRELTNEKTKRKARPKTKDKDEVTVKSAKEYGRTVAAKIRRAKFVQAKSDLSKLQSSVAAPLVIAWDGSVEAFATTAELTGDLVQAVSDAVKHLKGSEWYQSLSEGGKKTAEGRLRDELEVEILKTSEEGREVLKLRKQLQPDSPQSQRLDEITKDLFEAIRKSRELIEKVRNDPNSVKDSEVKAAFREIEKQARKLEVFTNQVIPNDWGDLLNSFLQANLLTFQSLAKNPFYNIGRMAVMGLVNVTSEVIRYPTVKIAEWVSGKKVLQENNVSNFKAAAVLYGMKVMVTQGIPKAAKMMMTGSKADGVNYEYQQNRSLMPYRAFLAMMSDTKFGDMMGVPKEMLSRKEDGSISLNDRAKKFAEATLGLPAEFMFRLLVPGDVPFGSFARARALYLLGTSRGLKGKELKTFLRYPPKEAAEKANLEAAEATFQEDSFAAEKAQQMVSLFANLGSDTLADPVIKVAARSLFPFVKTPTNVIMQTLDFAIPLISVGKSFNRFRKGDIRKGSEYFAKAFVGYSMIQATVYLIANGLVTGALYGEDDETDERKERDLAYPTQPPNTINISGLKRKLNGENPRYEDGDEVTNYTAYGFFATILSMHANSEASKRRIKARKNSTEVIGAIEESGAINALTLWGNVPAALKSSLEQSFLMGTNTLLQAITEGEQEQNRLLLQMGTAASSIVLPNSLTHINKARSEYMPDLRDDDPMVQFKNVLLNKTFQTDNFPLRYDLEGNPIRNTPKGRNPYVFHLIDFTKTQETNPSPEMMEIKNVYLDTENASAIPEKYNVPRSGLTYDGKKYYLTSSEREEMSAEMQRLKFAELRELMRKSSYIRKSPAEKVEMMDKAYNKASGTREARRIKKKYVDIAKKREKELRRNEQK